MQNGNFALGGWGARAAAQVRRGGRARRGRAARSRPAGGGGGRVCRGVARGGAAGLGGVAEPRLRARQVGARPGLSGAPSPPGTAPSSAGWTRGEDGGSGEGKHTERTGGGAGVTHHLSRGRRSACPPQAAGAAALSRLLPPPRGPTPATATRAGA